MYIDQTYLERWLAKHWKWLIGFLSYGQTISFGSNQPINSMKSADSYWLNWFPCHVDAWSCFFGTRFVEHIYCRNSIKVVKSRECYILRHVFILLQTGAATNQLKLVMKTKGHWKTEKLAAPNQRNEACSDKWAHSLTLLANRLMNSKRHIVYHRRRQCHRIP